MQAVAASHGLSVFALQPLAPAIWRLGLGCLHLPTRMLAFVPALLPAIIPHSGLHLLTLAPVCMPAPVHVLSSASVPILVPALVHVLTHVVVLVPIVCVLTFVPALMPAPVHAVLFTLMPRSCPCLCLHSCLSQLRCPHVSFLFTALPSFEFIHLRPCPFAFMVIRLPLHALVHL